MIGSPALLTFVLLTHDNTKHAIRHRSSSERRVRGGSTDTATEPILHILRRTHRPCSGYSFRRLNNNEHVKDLMRPNICWALKAAETLRNASFTIQLRA
jgi:hypothetical protein